MCVRMCFFLLFTNIWVRIWFEICCCVIHWRVQLLSHGSWPGQDCFPRRAADHMTQLQGWIWALMPCTSASLWRIWVLVYSFLLWISKLSVVFCLPRQEGSGFQIRLRVGIPWSRAAATTMYNADLYFATGMMHTDWQLNWNTVTPQCSWNEKKPSWLQFLPPFVHIQVMSLH